MRTARRSGGRWRDALKNGINRDEGVPQADRSIRAAGAYRVACICWQARLSACAAAGCAAPRSAHAGCLSLRVAAIFASLLHLTTRSLIRGSCRAWDAHMHCASFACVDRSAQYRGSSSRIFIKFILFARRFTVNTAHLRTRLYAPAHALLRFCHHLPHCITRVHDALRARTVFLLRAISVFLYRLFDSTGVLRHLAKTSTRVSISLNMLSLASQHLFTAAADIVVSCRHGRAPSFTHSTLSRAGHIHRRVRAFVNGALALHQAFAGTARRQHRALTGMPAWTFHNALPRMPFSRCAARTAAPL